jgi:hypothetical protein
MPHIHAGKNSPPQMQIVVTLKNIFALVGQCAIIQQESTPAPQFQIKMMVRRNSIRDKRSTADLPKLFAYTTSRRLKTLSEHLIANCFGVMNFDNSNSSILYKVALAPK